MKVNQIATELNVSEAKVVEILKEIGWTPDSVDASRLEQLKAEVGGLVKTETKPVKPESKPEVKGGGLATKVVETPPQSSELAPAPAAKRKGGDIVAEAVTREQQEAALLAAAAANANADFMEEARLEAERLDAESRAKDVKDAAAAILAARQNSRRKTMDFTRLLVQQNQQTYVADISAATAELIEVVEAEVIG